jgi:glyoxylase-like metal-dependent hydrolase (beta-lactamase superfamily II)
MTSEPTGNPAIDHSLTNFEFAPLVTTKLSDSLALLSGPGGNMAVLVGASGALLVDSGVHPTARALAMGAAAFAEKPVTTLVNTHWHFDHTGGNEYFGKQGCAIVAHQNVRNRMGHDQKIEQFDFTFRASPPAALPSITFPDSLTLYSESEPVELHHVDPAHTDGDILVYFPKTNVLHMGDTFFNAFYPFIDYSTGGWIGGMAAAADRGLALCNAETRIIPGHGPLGSKAELAAFREMLVTTQGRLEKLLGAGKGVDDIVAAAPIKDLEEKWGHGFFTSDLFVRNATLGLKRHRQAAG